MKPESPWVLLEACPDPLAAQVLYGRLEAEGIPARLNSLSPIPGLAQCAEVHVPRAWLTRARACLAVQPPNEEELAALAACAAPEGGEGES